jgi:hypothetical protein
MGEMQGITTYLAGLTTLAMLVEAVRAAIWAVVAAMVFRRFGIVVVVERHTNKGAKKA